jgi:PAS domain S-box-containing protein
MKLILSQQIQAMRHRVQQLSQGAQGDTHQQELLPKVFDELDHALEELQTVEAELHQQQVQLLDTREYLESERQTYQELFEFAPVGYLLTSPDGVIRRANQTAAALFETTEKMMIGRSLALYVPEGERRPFRRAISELSSRDGMQEWQAQMQPWHGPAFAAALSVAVVRNQRGRPAQLRWMITKTAATSEPSERAIRAS